MKTVLLLGGPAAGQRVEVHGAMRNWIHGGAVYQVVPMCSHGEVHWFGVLDGADPLAILISGYDGGSAERELQAAQETVKTLSKMVPVEKYDSALVEIACFHDKGASDHLAATGSYSRFDEPSAVRTARTALAAQGYTP